MSPSFSNVLAAIVACVCLVGYQNAVAESPTVGAKLPVMSIDKHGQLALEGDDITYTPWRSDAVSEKVQIIQYLAATMSAKDVFAPFTDRLQSDFKEGVVEVTSIINLDAALWGTSGLVMSEIKKNKRKHPDSNFVLDKKGDGAKEWGLAKKDSALLIIDSGTVKFFSRASLTEAELENTLTLLKTLLPEDAAISPAS